MFVRGRYGHGGTRRLRPRVARRSGEGGRRRADRSGRPPHRSGALVPRRVHRRPRCRDDLLLGHAGRRQRVHDAADRGRTDRVPARELHGVEEPLLASRSTAATASLRSTASAAATASSGSRSTGCCPRWARRRRPSGSIPAPTVRGRSSSPSSSRTSGLAREPAAGLDAARAALAVVEQVYAQSNYDVDSR